MKCLLSLFLLFNFCTSGWSQDPSPATTVTAQVPENISLPALQQLAAQRAESVLFARRDLEVANLQFTAYRAGLKPRLEGNANLPNYFRTSTEVTQDDGTIAFREIELNNSSASLLATQRIGATGGLIGLETSLQRTDNFVLDGKSYNGAPLRLTLRQPILAFNPWRWDRKLLPLAREVSQRQLAAARAGAALDATALFFNLVSADQERQIAETNRAANEELFVIAEERYELGKINRGDLVQLRLELTSAEQNRLRARRLAAAASAGIYELLGLPFSGELLRPVLPDTVAAGVTVDRERAEQFLENRPELLEIQQQILTAEREQDRVRRDLGPRLDLEAAFGLIRGAAELAPIYKDPQNERIVSLRMSVPILDWGQRRALGRVAAADAELARNLGRRIENGFRGQLRQLLEQWETVREELRLAAEIRALANERFRISQESYSLGAIPLAQLTLAQQNRDQNNRAYADSLSAYWLTYANLGRLTLWDFITDQPLYKDSGS